MDSEQNQKAVAFLEEAAALVMKERRLEGPDWCLAYVQLAAEYLRAANAAKGLA